MLTEKNLCTYLEKQDDEPFQDLVWINNKLQLPINPQGKPCIWKEPMQQQLWDL